MKTNIFIPKTIRVGYQNRNDTYTGKLAYVIYIDEKGKVRKEASWSSWRDKKIEPTDFDNVPISGFVLNKKVGGHSSGWNHRQTYTRIYDPRGFEFEITIPNLLYILENTNSIKGKGLEGEFVFGWGGSDLILIPTDSPDYKEISEYNKIVHEKTHVKAKDLVVGATYKTKDSVDYVYMGRFEKYEREYERRNVSTGSNKGNNEYIYKTISKGKQHFFGRKEYSVYNEKDILNTIILKSMGNKFIDTVSIECAENYAELFDLLESNTYYMPYDESKDEWVEYTIEEFKEYIEGHSYWNQVQFYSKDGGKEQMYYDKEAGEFCTQGKYNYTQNRYDKNIVGTIDLVFEMYKPIYKNEYLTNGKFYRKVRV